MITIFRPVFILFAHALGNIFGLQENVENDNGHNLMQKQKMNPLVLSLLNVSDHAHSSLCFVWEAHTFLEPDIYGLPENIENSNGIYLYAIYFL